MAFDLPLLTIHTLPRKRDVDARSELLVVLLSESNEEAIVRGDAVVEAKGYATGIVLTRDTLHNMGTAS